MQEDGIAQVETNDLIEAIRGSLNDGAQKVFDIMTSRGEIYDGFTVFQRGPRGTHSDNHIERPRPAHIAKFLGTSPRQVNQWMKDIRLLSLAHGLTEPS